MTGDSTLTEGVSLRDLVQSLRLPQRVDGRGGATRGGWLPWTLTLLLALSTASLAARVYTAPAPANDSSITTANVQTPTTPASGSASVSASTGDSSKQP